MAFVEQRLEEIGRVDLTRRRYQRGMLFVRMGKRRKVWVGRWWEDTIEDGVLRRVRKSEVLGEPRN